MNYRDEFDDPPGSGFGFLGNVGPKAAFFVVLIALAFMVGVVWKLYAGSGNPAEQEVPIVRADDGPFKITPDDPGGMEIPHKDSTIFASQSDEAGRIENLLAEEDNEEPMPRSQLFAGLNTEKNPDLQAEAQDTPLDQPLSEDQERIVTMAQDAEKVVEEVVEDGVEALTSEPTAPQKIEPVIEPPKVEPAAAPTAQPVITPAAGDYYVQVGSVKSADGAESEWKKIQDKHPVLSNFSHRVEKADLGEKGIFYRIQAGPVSQATANSACNTIKQTDPNGCLLKKK